jgi:hypothetical protein
MSELSSIPPEQLSHTQERESRPRFDLSTIMGIKVETIEVSEESQEMAKDYIHILEKNKTNKAELAELAYGFRRQLQEDLKSATSPDITLEDNQEDRQKKNQLLRRTLIAKDETLAFAADIYRRLLSVSSDTLQTELLRHQQEKEQINGTYEEFKTIEHNLEEQRGKLISLLSEMFKRSGQEPKPSHLAKRALLESKVADLEEKLEATKQKNPDVAALIEYDTVKEYTDQLRTTGFIWTKSRQRLLQEVLQGALTSRPVVAMMGETGTGKTALARAASLELSSREPERTVGGDQEKFVRLLASPAIEQGRSYYEYGPVLRAMTGKSSSIDNQPSKGGGIFFDDEFNTRSTSVQRQILKFVAEARPGRTVSVPGTPLTVTVESGFLYLAAGNPPSERYEREETGIETKREFAGNVINVEYLEQSKDNPELYQVMLASLMDQKTWRLTAVTKEEVAPVWLTKDAATGEFHLDEDPKHGGYLYRFANAWSELNKAFSHKDTVLHAQNPAQPKAKYYLFTFILDAGVVLSWLDQYKASPRDRKEHLSLFFRKKLEKYLSQFPEDEQTIVREYFKHFNILSTELNLDDISKPEAKVLTPKDIGYLNPNVPRPREKTPPPKFNAVDFIDTDTGDIAFQYVKLQLRDGWRSGANLKVKDGAPMHMPKTAMFLGFVYDEVAKTVDQTRAILVDNHGAAHILDPEGIRDFYDLDVPPPLPTPETGTPFAYDRLKAKEYGFSELKVEKHEKAQKILEAVYARDPSLVTLHRAGTPDPDSEITPPATLATDKYKINEQALKDAWTSECPDLPNIPEKSIWFFQALAEHRLSQTINSDDPDFLKIASHHIPDFGHDSFMLVMDYPEFDYGNDSEKQQALTPQTKKILKLLFNTEDPIAITRDEVNQAIWSNHDSRIQSDKAKAVIRELLQQGENPYDYELRLMRYDEYSRAASTQGYGRKNLWTQFEGYHVHYDGRRNGLDGGDRGYGGAASVDGDAPRDVSNVDLALRLVLSRRNP